MTNGAPNAIKGAWISLDKPLEMTSAKAVAIVRRITGFKKAGHAGTLDPLATGVLPIALGEATKVVSFAQDRPKEYEFTVTFGEQTSTDDGEGETVATSAHRPKAAEIDQVIGKFVGAISQRPPIFSAIKVAGRRAYDLARAGDLSELPPRTVQVHSFTLLEMLSEDQAAFRVECGKGTYIRSLARDLSLEIGTVGHVSALRRTRVGPFLSTGAISLAKLEDLGHIPRLMEGLYPIEHVLDDIPAILVSDEEARRLKDGRSIQISSLQRSALEAELRLDANQGVTESSEEPQGIVGRAMNKDTLIALVEVLADSVKPKRVFNL